MMQFKLWGNLASDPRFRDLESQGVTVAHMRVASSPPGSDRTSYFDVTIWPPKGETRPPAEIEQWTKGDRVHLSGHAMTFASDGESALHDQTRFAATKWQNYRINPEQTGPAQERTAQRSAAAGCARE